MPIGNTWVVDSVYHSPLLAFRLSARKAFLFWRVNQWERRSPYLISSQKSARAKKSPASPLTIIHLRGFWTRPVSISSWSATRRAASFKGRRKHFPSSVKRCSITRGHAVSLLSSKPGTGDQECRTVAARGWRRGGETRRGFGHASYDRGHRQRRHPGHGSRRTHAAVGAPFRRL